MKQMNLKSLKYLNYLRMLLNPKYLIDLKYLMHLKYQKNLKNQLKLMYLHYLLNQMLLKKQMNLNDLRYQNYQQSLNCLKNLNCGIYLIDQLHLKYQMKHYYHYRQKCLHCLKKQKWPKIHLNRIYH